MKLPVFYTASLAIGDCICATPTVRKLSRVYGTKVKVYSHFPEVFENLPYVDETHDIKNVSEDYLNYLKRNFDVHFTFFHIGKKIQTSDSRGIEMKHAVMDIRQYHAIDLGFTLKDDELHCDFVPGKSRQIDLPEKYVCIHPFKNWPSRTWDTSNWNALVKMLLDANIPVVVIGKDKTSEDMIKYLKSSGYDDRVFSEIDERKTDKIEAAGILDLTNSTTISEAWHVINKAACVVTMDSGILHLAGTTDAWIVQLGSSIDPEFRAPYRMGSQSYKYEHVGGSCNIFCASNMKYYLRDWEHGYDGATPIQSVTLLDTCLEKKKTFECHPSPEQVFKKVEHIYTVRQDAEWNAKVKEFIAESKERMEIDAAAEISKTLRQELAEEELIKIQSGSLGDTIGALAVIDAYSQGKKIAVISKLGAETFGYSYPHITFYPHDCEPEFDVDSGTYLLKGNFYKDFKRIYYKFEKPLIEGYAEQLGVTHWNRPKIDVNIGERPIKAKYVCFSMHSTAQSKHWNYPDAWDQLCRMLRKKGLTPVCIDRFESFGIEGQWNKVPTSCVKRQGLSLSEMTNYIHHAEFFIGVSSGLSWVAHAVGKPVVMISGVTTRDNEFEEDTLRIINENVCHGCINFPDKYPFDSGDWMWCPEHKGTSRQFECTKTISPEEVFQKIAEWNVLNLD
jgi:autotransporter strand-loop-strand O-heptosyltransferase